jgi:hypothetical protein
MGKHRISSSQLKRKITLLCGDAPALADDIKALAHTAHDENQALLLAMKASEIALVAISGDLWGYLFRDAPHAMHGIEPN